MGKKVNEQAISEAVQTKPHDVDVSKTVTEEANNDRVEYILPFLPETKPGDSHTVTLNGINYQVRYGERVMIPIGVREILEQMVHQTTAVNAKIEELADKEREIAKIG